MYPQRALLINKKRINSNKCDFPSKFYHCLVSATMWRSKADIFDRIFVNSCMPEAVAAFGLLCVDYGYSNEVRVIKGSEQSTI